MKRSLLICALFLCGMEDAVLSQHGYCAKSRCFAVFQEPADVWSARSRCGDMGAQLFEFDPQRAAPLLGFLRGRYWVSDPGRRAQEAPGADNCSSVSVSVTGTQNVSLLDQLCADHLDGFVCQLTFRDSCTRLQVSGASRVNFTTVLGFQVKDVFPRGTVAVTHKVGATFPVSKHVCFEKRWLRAPWSCEVMGGGCEHHCNPDSRTCACPTGKVLHPNNITCAEDPCASCAHRCVKEGGAYQCRCDKGYMLAPDRKSCVDIDECKDEDEDYCSEEGEVCINTEGGYECACAEDFNMEDGECVDVSICLKCEHMKCEKVDGVYECMCRKGFKVSPTDPTRCELHCPEEECEAHCVPNPDLEKRDIFQCFCPDGYIQDTRNGTALCIDIDECDLHRQCDHTCHNHYGGFRCTCQEGFELLDGHKCAPTEADVEVGEVSRPVRPTPARVQPTAVPSYVKTGSVLGIAVFAVLCVGLLYVLVSAAARRCSRVQLYSFKHGDMDIFSLQQVTTETYKRLSIDKQFRSDSH